MFAPAPTATAKKPTSAARVAANRRHAQKSIGSRIKAGDGVAIADPADRATRPLPPRRGFERPPLASSGITAEQASREISRPHYGRPPVPFDRPEPPVEFPPVPARRR